MSTLSNFSLVWDEFFDISFISSMKIYHTFKFLNYLINPQQNYNKFENTYTRNVSTYISITLSLNTKKLVTNYNVYNINFWISIFSYQLAKYIRLVIFIFFFILISLVIVWSAHALSSRNRFLSKIDRFRWRYTVTANSTLNENSEKSMERTAAG